MPRFIPPQFQFLNALGLPLSGGSLYFYETGTTTPKNVYLDDDFQTPAPNPVPLDAGGFLSVDVFTDGTYKEVLRDSSGNLIWEKDPAGADGAGSRNAFTVWQAGVTYGIINVVTGSDGNLYKSLLPSNLNNNPVSSPSSWERVAFIGFYNATITYPAGKVVQDLTGNLWKSRQAANIGNTPQIDSVWWEPAVDDKWISKTASFSALANKSYLVSATGAAADVTLPALAANETIVVHNNTNSTQLVGLLTGTFTATGSRGSAAAGDRILIPVGRTLVAVCRGTNLLEVL
jgi:hypothetical protein